MAELYGLLKLLPDTKHSEDQESFNIGKGVDTLSWLRLFFLWVQWVSALGTGL